MSIRTGPGRPLRAMKSAFDTASGISLARVTWQFHFVTGALTDMTSVSWNASEPSRDDGTWPVMHTTGVLSIFASAIPVSMLVAPGPEVAMQTPVFPDARAYPSAAWIDPCS